MQSLPTQSSLTLKTGQRSNLDRAFQNAFKCLKQVSYQKQFYEASTSCGPSQTRHSHVSKGPEGTPHPSSLGVTHRAGSGVVERHAQKEELCKRLDPTITFSDVVWWELTGLMIWFGAFVLVWCGGLDSARALGVSIKRFAHLQTASTNECSRSSSSIVDLPRFCTTSADMSEAYLRCELVIVKAMRCCCSIVPLPCGWQAIGGPVLWKAHVLCLHA